MTDPFSIPSFVDVKAAHRIIHRYAYRTPVFTSAYLNKTFGTELFFKCENFQKVGAFKFRGACNAIMTLPEESAIDGVATHSSGNHAQAVALTAKLRGIPAYIVMPENAPRVKINAVNEYGAEITFCEATLEARKTTLHTVVQKMGAIVIHPYNDARIICGQGTAALELLEDFPELDSILAPVGGGGLLSGTALSAKSIKPNIEVFGIEPEEADDACRSFKAGKIIPLKSTNTIADGLRTSLGHLPFELIKTNVDDIITVSEKSIVVAMRAIWERMNIIIEPSGAVPLAAIYEQKIDVSGKKTGVILTGGNVDLERLPW